MSRKADRVRALVEKMQSLEVQQALLEQEYDDVQAEYHALVDGHAEDERLADDIIDLDLPIDQRVLKLMAKQPGAPWKTKRIAALLVVEPRTISVVLGRLMRAGELLRVGHGVYRLQHPEAVTSEPKP